MALVVVTFSFLLAAVQAGERMVLNRKPEISILKDLNGSRYSLLSHPEMLTKAGQRYRKIFIALLGCAATSHIALFILSLF